MSFNQIVCCTVHLKRHEIVNGVVEVQEAPNEDLIMEQEEDKAAEGTF